MTDLQFKHTVLDPLSESFCAAKWYNASERSEHLAQYINE